MRISIKTKIWLSICSIVIFFTSFSYYYFPRQQEKLLLKNYDKQVETLSNSVALGVKIAMKEQDFEGVQDAIDFVRNDSRLQFISIISYDTIYEEGRKNYELKKTIYLTVPENQHPDPEMQSSDSVIIKKREFSSASLSGAIMLGFNTKAISDSMEEIKITSFAVSLIILLVGILIGFLLARHISKPVEALRDAAQKVGEGNLYHKVSKFNKDEIGDLSVAFNKMVDDLAHAREDLKLSNSILSEQKQVIEEKHEEIQEQHRQLVQSIEYARRIQGSILPPQKMVKQQLEESFILYLPKDIVAGDFYWMAEAEGEILFAACDCTGHGVPGAMVSVICSNALNKAVSEMQLNEPARILDKVCELVMTGFYRGENEDEFIRDGMDISLCRLDKKTLRLQWAGAYNPLWIIRSTEGQPEIIEIKANKQSIGNSSDPFTNHETVLKKGDCLYLFTDGYSDQFGGPQDKKLNKKRFRELLLSIQNEPLYSHGEILRHHHEEWKGSRPQVDDICVFGVQV